MRARFSPRGAFGGDVAIDMYPEYFAADTLAGVVEFSLAADMRLGHVTIDSRAALRADYTYRQLVVGERDS